MSAYSPHQEEIECKDGVKRRIVIEQVEFPEDPLENIDWCEIVTMSGMRGSYGHKQVSVDWLRPYGDDNKVPYLHGDPEEPEFFEKRDPIMYLPVGKHEHGGIEFYIGGTAAGDAAGWDSGQIGWIWMDAKGFKEWQGVEWTETKENIELVEAALTAVVEEYSHYISGDVWCTRIEKWIPACSHGHGGEWEYDDAFTSCGGYIGDWDECGILEDAKSEVESTVEHMLHNRKWWVKAGKWIGKRWAPARKKLCRHKWGEPNTCVSVEGIDKRAWCTKGCGSFEIREVIKKGKAA